MVVATEEPSFAEVVEMIQAARGRALTAVNTTLIDLYWQVGEFISRRIEMEGWGNGRPFADTPHETTRKIGMM